MDTRVRDGRSQAGFGRPHWRPGWWAGVWRPRPPKLPLLVVSSFGQDPADLLVAGLHVGVVPVHVFAGSPYNSSSLLASRCFPHWQSSALTRLLSLRSPRSLRNYSNKKRRMILFL
ncbi:MAG: hypothetical protein AVDCRST_MAG03-3146 [uncultured Rubrobacteraceae bacterium]|uniref:Uncharacterized protein n=1 Tax=uncultured Rubrobacteraceae bacterium TaxID=349277 RepID=A0A6J4Q725_9ACTN|nr:MAG: hypothetical protein AVDCRST_MAG03-3146 [uncultured Rubrobacteraceae bacterium]